MRISVIGCGYLGAVHAACMAELGHTVVGLDIDEAKVEQLRRGVAPFHEPGLPELLARHVGRGKLTFTTDPADIAEAEVHFIAVGTPQRDDGLAADLSYVDAAVTTLLKHARPAEGATRPVLVVGKSTVPVGTAQAIQQRIDDAESDLALAWNPEFLREGFAVQDTLHPDRIVYGLPDDAGVAAAAHVLLDEVYADILAAGTPRIVMNFPTAELVKVAANSFLATKISFINAMAELCEATGGDVTLLAEAIGHDDRIGSKFLQAGIGFGGGCLPKDIRAFMARAEELGVDEALGFLQEVDDINLRRRDHAVSLALRSTGGDVEGKRIAVLGITFKPNTDDMRDSPALDIALRLRALGAEIVVVDPAAGEALTAEEPELQVATSVDEAVRGAHAVMLLTPWREFLELDPAELGELAASRIVIDGRNVLDPNAWTAAGWQYHGMGRGTFNR